MAQAPKQAINVMISGAAGQIGYSLIPLFAGGLVFGPDQPMNLILLDIESMMERLQGTVMEIEDGAYPLVESIVPTFKAEEGFKDLDYAILVGGLPRKGNQTRGDLLVANIKIFKSAGESLAKYAKPTCKVLVVANPANSNCYVCAHYACEANKEFKKTNFAALTRLDMNRAQSQLANKLNTIVRNIDNVVIWGNHSATQVPDIRNATNNGNKVNVDANWLPQFESTVQQRGKAVIAARGASSAMSAANGVKDCIRDWHLGTNGRNVAMAIYTGAATKSARNSSKSDAAETTALKNALKGDDAKEAESKKCKEFAEPLVKDNELFSIIADIAPDTYFSVPCVCENGNYTPVSLDGKIVIEDDLILKIAATGVELQQEKAAGLAVLNAK